MNELFFEFGTVATPELRLTIKELLGLFSKTQDLILEPWQKGVQYPHTQQVPNNSQQLIKTSNSPCASNTDRKRHNINGCLLIDNLVQPPLMPKYNKA